MIHNLLNRFPALQSQDFRKLFYNYVLSSAARWAEMLGRGWLIFEITGSTGAVGIVTFCGMVPSLLFGPIGGALADRFDRRLMAMWSAGFGVLFSALLGILAISGHVVMWHVVVLSILQGTAFAAVTPASEALIPSLVPREHLLNAISFRGIARHGSKVIGPLLGGVLIVERSDGSGWVFILTAVFLILSISQLYRISWRNLSTRSATQQSNFDVFSPIAEAARYVVQDRRILMILFLIGGHCGFTMAYDSLLPGLATEVGGGGSTFAAITVAVGIGALIGTLGVSMISNEYYRGPFLIFSGLGSGIALLMLGFTNGPIFSVLAGFIAGCTQAPFMALSATFVQEIVPDEFRGRVMAFYLMIAAGFMALMNLGFGFVADSFGERLMLIIPSAFWLLLFVLGAFAYKPLNFLLRRGVFLANSETISEN
ncbi:MAG: MFS transporter [Dehalococcoidia bacterium]|nr:MFS transporter [Dehalococcoidia bacterium]